MQNHTSGNENKEYLNKNTINIFKKDDERILKSLKIKKKLKCETNKY